MVSDASGFRGCGAFCLPHWFNLQWSANMQTFPIAVKELFPVVIAVAIYGNQWSGKLVLFRVDNMAVVEVLKAAYSREPHLTHLIRMLAFFAAHFNFWFSASHVAGSENMLADSLSHNNAKLFLSQVSQASCCPSRIPLPIIKLLECNLTYMDYHSLDVTVQGYFAAALALSTHSTYKTAKHRYLSFCTSFHITPLPATEATLCYFVACLDQQSLAHSTIRTYLSGVIDSFKLHMVTKILIASTLPNHKGGKNQTRSGG